jgi:hypothetical protein
MHIRVSERESFRGAWRLRVDTRAGAPAEFPPLSESSELHVAVTFDDADEPADLELRVGNILVASSRPADRTEFFFAHAPSDDHGRRLAVSGPLLRDWIGVTELTLDAVTGDQRQTLLHVDDLRVGAGKMAQEVFEALFAEVAAHSSALLLDVYGKTFFGLEPEFQSSETAPVAALKRLRGAVDRLTAALRDIARRPALRLQGRLVREPALAGQSVGELTLQEACLDPTLAVRVGRGVAFREQIREHAVHHFDLPENRVLTGFLKFLQLQIGDLRARARREIEQRYANRAYRDRPGEGPSWWEQEDLPRIRELQQEIETLALLDREIVHLLRLPFLPAAPMLREVPASTPLFRSHRAYADAFRAIVGHFQSYRVQLDGGHLLARARSLPQLYESWCYLEVMRVLRSGLTMVGSGEVDSPFRRVAAERDRFVIEFASDQFIDFHDRTGRLVRLRYVPRYRNRFYDRFQGYGLLGPEPEMTPDLALELYPAKGADGPPELIIVLDAKYSTVPHPQILERVRSKYGRIGVFDTGGILSRQVWALAPTAPMHPAAQSPEWGRACTIDNLSFWSDTFDASTPVAGVIHARPLLGSPPPLESMLRWLLEREGLVLVAP